MAEVLEINDIHELASYRLAAGKLLAETPRASFFHTVDWLESYWEHYAANQRLRVLVIKAAGQTIGLLPLVVRTRPSRLGSLRVLTYPLDNWGSWFGPLGRNQSAAMALAWRHLERTPHDWDLIDLPWTDHAGADRGRTLRTMRNAGWNSSATPSQLVSYINLEGSFDDYLASRGKKFRHELRRTRRRVEEAGCVEFIRHRPTPLRDGDGDPRWDLYNACEQIASRSWQANSKTGNTLTHPSCCDFLRRAHAAAARQGAVDLCLLRISDRPVAFHYSYHREGRVFGLRMGYDRRVQAPPGLGKTLTHFLIEDSCERGDQLIEFGEGDDAYKHRWRTGVAQSWRIQHAPLSSWRGQASLLRQRWAKGSAPAAG